MSLFSQSGVSLNHMEKLSSNTIDQTCQKALEILEHPDWKEGKTFTEEGIYQIKTAKLHPIGSEKLPWHRRTSFHPVNRDLSYEEFRNGLLLDHTTNEQQYIPDLKHCSKVKTFREELPEVEVYLIQVGRIPNMYKHTTLMMALLSFPSLSTRPLWVHQTASSLLWS